MKRISLARTNLLICVSIIVGFCITAAISYRSNQGAFERDMENVTRLASEGIAYEIDATVSTPIHISLAMANDELLKDFLRGEQSLDEETFLRTIRNYLSTYQDKYGYHSVFLVSAATGHYYHYKGADRTVAENNPDDQWYYDILASEDEYILNIDGDQASANEITVFINTKIVDTDGSVMGIVGVGLRVDSLQQLLQDYERRFDLHASLIGTDGAVEVSSDRTGLQPVDFFENSPYPHLRNEVLSNHTDLQEFKYSHGYLTSRYIPDMEWFLVVEHDTAALDARSYQQLLGGILMVALTITLVLAVITKIYHLHSAQLLRQAAVLEEAREALYRAMGAQPHGAFYEVDLTHDRPVGAAAALWLERLNAPPDTPYSTVLRLAAQKQVEEAFRGQYLETFAPPALLSSFQAGQTQIRFPFRDASGVWMCVAAALFRWEEDGSVHMLACRQVLDGDPHDAPIRAPMNEAAPPVGPAAAMQIQSLLRSRPNDVFAFFLLSYPAVPGSGHPSGEQFQRVRTLFQETDLVVQLSEHELAAFLPLPDRAAAECWAWTLSAAVPPPAFIGAALAPAAGSDFESLYRSACAALAQAQEQGGPRWCVYPAEKPD